MDGAEHHLFMVALYQNDLANALIVYDGIKYTFTISPSIDDITQENQRVILLRTDGCQ